MSLSHASVPSTEAMLEAYQLKPPVTAAKKKPKLRQPRDCSQTIAAAKKKAKTREAAAAKALGADPQAQKLQSLDERRTGLRNLGATCYMNSLLQTLFMNRAFRRGIFQWTDPDPAPEVATSAQAVAGTSPQDVASGDGDGDGGGPVTSRGAKDILTQLQMLFAQLQHSGRTCYDPTAFVQAQEFSIDIGAQQDPQEFSKYLLTALEDQLALSPEPSVVDLVPALFRGKYCCVTTCSACEQPSASSATKIVFYELPLNVLAQRTQATVASSLQPSYPACKPARSACNPTCSACSPTCVLRAESAPQPARRAARVRGERGRRGRRVLYGVPGGQV